MDVALTRTTVDVKLSAFEQIAALKRDLSIPRHQIAEASVDPTPMRSIRGRFTFGLRAPGFIFVCSSSRGRHFWAIRRDTPALHLRLRRSGSRRLEQVTVSTPDAEALAAELTQSARTAPGGREDVPAAQASRR